jgi:CDP-6-deoxy-D-xylo-4-hexulose-3-dehydrase
MNTPEELRAEILRLTREYSSRVHRSQQPAHCGGDFVPGETPVPYAGRVFTEDEVEAGVGSMLDFWLTLGKEGEEFEHQLAQFLGVKRTILVTRAPRPILSLSAR